MIIKLFHLNIFQGIYLDRVIKFVLDNQIDILHFQEVTSGKMSRGGGYNYPGQLANRTYNPNENFVGVNCFEEIKNSLNMHGELVKTYSLINDEDSSLGNATFFNDKFELLDKKVLWYKDFMQVPEGFTNIDELSRAALILKLKTGNREFTDINTHLTWGPTPDDEPYKVEQAKILYEELKKTPAPFILSGDFNVTPETETASMFNDLARNLTVENNVKNTLNGEIHPAKNLFPPGLAVDYIFVSQDINVKTFKVVEESLSDHLGLMLEFEL